MMMMCCGMTMKRMQIFARSECEDDAGNESEDGDSDSDW